MQYVECSCTNQTLEATAIPRDLQRGTRGYLGVRVSFSGAAWSGCKVAVEFKGDARPLNGGTCAVPDEIAAKPYVTFRLVGEKGDGYRVLTNWVTIKQD